MKEQNRPVGLLIAKSMSGDAPVVPQYAQGVGLLALERRFVLDAAGGATSGTIAAGAGVQGIDAAGDAARQRNDLVMETWKDG